MSFNAKSPQPGESAAKHDEDLPKVKESTRTQNIKNHIVLLMSFFKSQPAVYCFVQIFSLDAVISTNQ